MLRKIFRFLAQAFDTSLFIIRLENGKAQLTKGRVPRGFLSDITDAMPDMGIKTGVIKGVRQNTYIRISFSDDIPAEFHQRLRNIWHFHEPGFRTGG